MAYANKVTGQYIDFIANEVITKFGGSYQTVETLGKTWRQKMEYRPDIEIFITDRTNDFLNLLDSKVLSNFNIMYQATYNISDHLSKYLAKKSPDVTKRQVAQEFHNKIFFNSPKFINKFNRIYKKPIDLSNEEYVAANAGVIAMYRSVRAMQK